MCAEHGLIFLSWFLCIMVCYVDRTGESADPASMRKSIDSTLFSSHHRRMAVYFLSLLGMPLDLILHSWWDFWSDPLIYLGGYLLTFLGMLLISAFFAKNLGGMLSEPGHRDRLRALMKRPCWQEFTKSASEKDYAEDEAVRLLLNTMSKVRLLGWFVEKLAAWELSEECIDEILGTAIFDRFEPTVSHPHGSRWVSSKDRKKYAAGKRHLLIRNDEAGRLFRDSLNRWKAKQLISEG